MERPAKKRTNGSLRHDGCCVCPLLVFSVSCYCSLEPAWNVEKVSLAFRAISFRAITFVLHWLTVTITKANKIPIVFFSFYVIKAL